MSDRVSPERGAPASLGFGRRITIELERTVAAPMDVVWDRLRDYRDVRARLLTEHFADYVVREGGVGAGTVIGYRLRIAGHERAYALRVEEPVPNCRLRERDHHARLLATWTLTPGGEGERTFVRVEVQLRDPALDGWFARVRARRALRRVHARLLERLARQLAARD
jgi:hypothetical protein